MAQMNVVENNFKLPIDIVENGQVKKVLKTKDKYVDKNIEVVINTPDAALEAKETGAITATVSTTDTTYTSDTATKYAIEIAADAHVNASKVGVATAGFAALEDEVVIAAADAEQNTKTIYVKEGALNGTGDASAEGHGITLGAKLNAAPEEGFFIKVGATGSVGVATAGWVDPEDTEVVSTDAEAFYSVAKVNFSNTATGTYEEITAPVLVSGDYLYISEGYTPAVKLALSQLVPDQATVVAGDNKFIYNTVSVYDKDGKLIAGSMGDAELSEITANDAVAKIQALTVAAADGGANFKVTATGAISGNTSVQIATRGLAETDLAQTGAITGTATVDATLAKIGLGVNIEDNDLEVTPVIKKETSTAKTVGGAVTAAPAGKYVAISADAIAASTSITPVVNAEGYGTADVHSATAGSVKGGSAASGTYYVELAEGSHAITIAEPSVTNASATVATDVVASTGADLSAGVLTAAPSGAYLTISADATPVKGNVAMVADCAVTEGYVTADASQVSKNADVIVNVTAAQNKYIAIYDGSLLD